MKRLASIRDWCADHPIELLFFWLLGVGSVAVASMLAQAFMQCTVQP